MRRVVASLVGLLVPAFAYALPREPAVSRTQVAFVEAGQVWVVPRGAATSGPATARRVTETPGAKSSPRFSPDGTHLAFTSAEFRDEANLYTVPVGGGEPARITFLPGRDVLCQWTADGRLLFYTSALSFSPIETQLFAVPAGGGLPVALPLHHGSDGSLDETGTWLAYTPQWPNPLIAGWKRYRGGAAPDVWLLNTATGASSRITSWTGADLRPMWHEGTLYYLSDEGDEARRNLWSYDPASGARRQVTRFHDEDVRNPSIGPGAIVFELGAGLHLLDLATGRSTEVEYTLPADGVPALVVEREVERWITHRELASGGRAILYEARGDLWIVGDDGAARNLTATSGVFEREAALSPDGRSVAYWSDASGEYQLHVRELDTAGVAAPLTRFTDGFRRRPVWSPDQRRLAFADVAGRVFVLDLASRALTEVDQSSSPTPVELAWASDSGSLAYTLGNGSRNLAIWRWDGATGERARLTSEAFYAEAPAFTADGRFLLFVSYRDFSRPVSDPLQRSVVHRGVGVPVAVDLARVEAWDADSVEARGRRLPAAPGALASLAATHDGRVLYGLTDLAGEESVRLFDPATGNEEVLVAGTVELALSADRRYVLVEEGDETIVIEIGSGERRAAPAGRMTARVDLRAEWRQIFAEVRRLYRDLFYAPKVPQGDWDAIAARYAPRLERCLSREEVESVLAEMIGESSVGHAYVGASGDVPRPPRGSAAMPGADFELVGGAFRIARIPRGAPWDEQGRSPLSEAREGEYLLAVGGVPLDTGRDVRAAFHGHAGEEIAVTLGADPAGRVTRELRITPIASENELRRRAWVEGNRRWVAAATNGRVGYVHVPSFSRSGFGDAVRQLYGQMDRDALILDARWSLGGSVGATLVELLARRPLTLGASRFSDHPWPESAHFGPKALLVNHITVSNGENFAYAFRKLGLGPIVGSRTWGGLTGLDPVPPLIDGGYVNVPNVPFYDEMGYVVEGRGVEPDVVVEHDPAAAGDAQLDAAITKLLAAVAAGPAVPRKPPG